MADRGPPTKLGETKSFQMTVPLPLYEYLEWLARHSVYGPTAKEAAVKLLTERINHMIESEYHNNRVPND